MVVKTFGEFLKQKRIAQGRTLRAFCHEQGFDHGNYSRMERGVLPPPQKEEKLAEYAEALGIARGSDEWLDLRDLASVALGRIPKDLMSDEALHQEVFHSVPYHPRLGGRLGEAGRTCEKIRLS